MSTCSYRNGTVTKLRGNNMPFFLANYNFCHEGLQLLCLKIVIIIQLLQSRSDSKLTTVQIVWLTLSITDKLAC